MEENTNNTPAEIIQPSKPNVLIYLLIAIVSTALGAGGVLAYQKFSTPSFQPTPVPSPTPITDLTANWEKHANSVYLYEFKCPTTSTYKITLTNGNGNDKPLYEETCYEGTNQLTISVYPISSSKEIPEFSEGAYAEEKSSNQYKFFLRGFDKTYFDQILSTFEFAEQ